MWEEITLSIVLSVSEAICTNRIERKVREKINNKIKSVVIGNMGKFADTSLDCNEFYELVNSRKFIEILRNYFCSTRDGMATDEYVNYIEKYIYSVCSSLNHLEVREFIQNIRIIYSDFLNKIIMESPELNILFQLLIISHREILGKISESEENLMKYISSFDNEKIQIDNDEIKAYHDVCKKEFGTIRFTGISGAESKKAQDLIKFYVENTFSYYTPKEFEGVYRTGLECIEPIKIKDFFHVGNKIVIIGGAGLGKTTTLNYLFCNYEEMYNAYAVKIKIDLKEYAKDIGENKKDLLWCITTEFRKKIKRTKLTFEDTEKKLAEFLDIGKCLVILDALDEIPTQSVRDKVRNEIASFSEIYFLNRFIISTREAGYLRNRFDDTFLHIKINEFGNDQIKKYSYNWFCSNYARSEFKDFWKRFQIEVKRARCQNLVRNPIVLILALVIFDIEKNLPNKRVEFYKKCIETFLTVREDRKAAFILSEKAKNILGIDLVVPKIAYYKFSHINENMGYKFNYEELKSAVLLAIEVEDAINWSDAVKQYSEYLVARTELIREIDEDILDFAHKTFYEYFLAVYFTKELDDERLKELLHEWIGDSNYDELARLIIEVIIQNDEPRKHKYIIEYLFSELHEEEYENPNNKMDIFLIIVDLYNHNMLQPKFHSLYNKCILYFPRYVDNANGMLRHTVDELDIKVRYDSKILADMYCEAVLTRGEFKETLDSIYYLNNEFKKNIINNIRKDNIANIVELFTVVRGIPPYRKRKNQEQPNIKGLRKQLNYFMNEGIEYVLNYPQIYCSIIYVMTETNSFEGIEKLACYLFTSNRSFYYCSSPRMLISVVNESRNNKYILLIMLILIIECSERKTNIILGYLFGLKTERDEENSKEIFDFVYWIWSTFNIKKSFEKVKKELQSKDLYVEEAEAVYIKLYKDYYEREREIVDHRINVIFDNKR